MSVLLAQALLCNYALAQSKIFIKNLPQGDPTTPQLMVRSDLSRMQVPKLCPQRFGIPPKRWEFEWITSGYVQTPGDTAFRLRILLYSQEHREVDDPAPKVVRMLLRLWAYNYAYLRLDQDPNIHAQAVDVYLCWGGTPGGEQLFDQDTQIKPPIRVNTIYFYALRSFTDPVEEAREVAHEYGHATLPAVGGFQAPEDWANGFLGERLFLLYLRNAMSKGWLSPDDTMGANLMQLDQWVKKNVDPGDVRVAHHGPEEKLLHLRTAAAFQAYLDLGCYAAEALPTSVLRRSLILTGSTHAYDYPQAIVEAAAEPDRYEVQAPPGNGSQPIWIPLGKGHILNGKVLARATDGWAKVEPQLQQITVVNR